MKKILSIAILLVMCLTINIFAQGEVNVNINGSTTVKGVLIDGTTLVPVRVISESMGATVSWEGTIKTVTIVKGDKTIKLQVNGKDAKLIGNTTYVPVRFVSESLGLNVEWDGATKTVNIGDKVDVPMQAIGDSEKDLKELEELIENSVVSGKVLGYSPNGDITKSLWTLKKQSGEYSIYMQGKPIIVSRNTAAQTEFIKALKYYLPSEGSIVWNNLIEMINNKQFGEIKEEIYDGKKVKYYVSGGVINILIDTKPVEIAKENHNKETIKDSEFPVATYDTEKNLKKLKDMTTNTIISGNELVYTKSGNTKFRTWTVKFNTGGYSIYIKGGAGARKNEDAKVELLKVIKYYLTTGGQTVWDNLINMRNNEEYDQIKEESYDGKSVKYFMSSNGTINIYIK